MIAQLTADNSITDEREGRGVSLYGSAVEYALHCLLWLAPSRERPASSRDLAELTGVSPALVAKLLPKLEKAGVLEAQGEIAGGYRLARPAGEITVLDIVDAVDGGKGFIGTDLNEFWDVHVLVNNPGYVWNGPLHKIIDRQWDGSRTCTARRRSEFSGNRAASWIPAWQRNETPAPSFAERSLMYRRFRRPSAPPGKPTTRRLRRVCTG
jgi:Rrf2 family protein